MDRRKEPEAEMGSVSDSDGTTYGFIEHQADRESRIDRWRLRRESTNADRMTQVARVIPPCEHFNDRSR